MPAPEAAADLLAAPALLSAGLAAVRQNPLQILPVLRAADLFSRSSPSSGSGGSSFLRGVGGGLVGGMIGNMLFGGTGHAGSGGGSSGGIGIFELLILGGLGYFIYRRFIKS